MHTNRRTDMHTPTNYRHNKNVCVYVCSCLNYRKIAKCKQFLGKVKEAKKKKNMMRELHCKRRAAKSRLFVGKEKLRKRESSARSAVVQSNKQ